jgi:hypothetical protein
MKISPIQPMKILFPVRPPPARPGAGSVYPDGHGAL